MFSDGQSAAIGAVLFGGLGAVVGALVAPGEKWESVDAKRVSFQLAPAPGRGVAARVALTF